MSRKRVLITGAAGLIGGVLRSGLGDRYELTCLDVEPIDGPGTHRADMTDLDAVLPAFEGQDAVVDLAARPSATLPWAEVYANNVPATLNALEGARRHGVPRFVFASSNYVTSGYELDEPYASVMAGRYDGLDPEALPRLAPDAPVRPDCFYAVGKALGEAACRYHSDQHGLSAICIRIGTVNEENRPQKPHHFAKLLTHRDLVELVERCVEAGPDVRFETVYGVSDNTWRFWDTTNAKEVLGYAPADDAEAFRT